MNWKDMSIPKRIALGFTVVILGIVVIGILNYTGVGKIVSNAGQVIDGNKLKGMLIQREVDHLNWAGEINTLLTDDKVKELNVETDHHKCEFGKFLFGEERREAEKLVPSLATIFKDIEEPHKKLHESAIAIGKVFKQADTHLPQFLVEKEVDHLKWMSTIDRCFLDNKKELKVITDPHKCGLGIWLYGEGARKATANNPELARLIEELKIPHAKLHESAIEIQDVYQQIHPGLIQTLLARLDDHRVWASKVSEKIIKGDHRLGVSTDPAKCAFGKFLLSDHAKEIMKNFPELRSALESSKEPHERLHKSAIEIEKALSKGNKARAERIYNEKTMPYLRQVASHFADAIESEEKLVQANHEAAHIYDTKTHKFFEETHDALVALTKKADDMLTGMEEANRIYATVTNKSLHETQSLLHKLISETEHNIMTDDVLLSSANDTRRNSMIVGVIGVLLGIIIAFVIARAITSVLKIISSQLEQGATQVAAASGQVSSSSQQLAEGASEQAASIEETSSSLEEMSSMTKQNSENANQANNLMKESNQVVEEANNSMTELTSSMEEITKASEETSKIIKTIDEVAFQTNLLALNAAVEAARAGEAGAGFAVVADEVRNLAMRTADAAKNTANLIEGTVKKVGDGSELVTKTNKAFKRVAESTKKVGELVGEISVASSEQAEGIEQVNKAVVEMDKVVQQNAANAEESASASEEMNAQAEQMKGSVGELMALVGGKGMENGHPKERSLKETRFHPVHHELSAKAHEKKTGHKQIAAHKGKRISPEAVIPMDEDFENF